MDWGRAAPRRPSSSSQEAEGHDAQWVDLPGHEEAALTEVAQGMAAYGLSLWDTHMGAYAEVHEIGVLSG